MNAISLDISSYLVSQGLGAKGGQSDWAIYRNQTPASGQDNGVASDNVITLTDTSGPPPARTMNASQKLAQFTGLQIMARGTVQNAVYERLKLIYDNINSIEKWITINNTIYMNFQPMSDINIIARDERQRWIWTVNYQVIRK